MVFLDVGVGDRPAVGVGVDQQDLSSGGRRLEGEVDGNRGAARRTLGPPYRGQHVPGVALRLGWDLVG
jgi:hypothetical protein